ncbi:MAG TPA: M1 family aminopeptidase, partial [Vicinamibacterales bacterium]|nr:M1 family aminopeptidase [Vicinamibacterales bacterium]
FVSVNADPDEAAEFFDAAAPQGVTRAVVRERDRVPLEGALPGNGHRLTVDVFVESGPRGQLSTWRLDLRRPAGTMAVAGETDSPWRVVAQQQLSQLDALHRLALNRDRPFTARDFVLTSVDFELRLASGSVFVADTTEGITALVLLGEGQMTFHPTPKTERGQVRLFTGGESVESRFETAFVRVNPYEFEQQLAAGTLTPATPDPRMFARARDVFDDHVALSFSLDLSDLSRDTWSVLPQPGDMVAEVRTRKYRTLTYVRAGGEPEDVTLFSRERKRNISIYASPQKLANRGAYYNEDDLAEFDVLDYDIAVDISPARQWLTGVATMKLRVQAFQVAALNLKLAENLTISSVSSKELGRLLFLRVRDQAAVVVNLPAPLSRDDELTLTVRYQGRFEGQAIDSESVQENRDSRPPQDLPLVTGEPNWLLSNRASWYPQAGNTDYATAALRVAVPVEYSVVASGVPAASPDMVVPASEDDAGQRLFNFRTTHPVRYLGIVVSRMTRVDAATVALDIVVPPPPPPPRSVTLAELLAPPKPVPVGSRNTIDLTVLANRRQEGRGRDALDTTAEILRFYASLVGDAPYPSFTLAMLEDDLPGGHSPAYFAVLNNPLPTTPFVWRNDPATFNDFPEFILAHEVAHQWWGQAVGWKNYHEQWISEAFAQYFATLYARERRGDGVFQSALRNLRRWAMDRADQGPISLGYRLGHVKNESRDFRAIVYNKGAAVLHTLRRLVGDEAFFKGLRRFYAENRYMKAGTDDLRRAMEAESGRSLERFFERWVLDAAMPRVRYRLAAEGDAATLAYEQVGEVFDLPVTATLRYADGTSEDVVVVLSEAAGTVTLTPRSTLRSVELNRDDVSLGHFDRK